MELASGMFHPLQSALEAFSNFAHFIQDCVWLYFLNLRSSHPHCRALTAVVKKKGLRSPTHVDTCTRSNGVRNIEASTFPDLIHAERN